MKDMLAILMTTVACLAADGVAGGDLMSAPSAEARVWYGHDGRGGVCAVTLYRAFGAEHVAWSAANGETYEGLPLGADGRSFAARLREMDPGHYRVLLGMKSVLGVLRAEGFLARDGFGAPASARLRLKKWSGLWRRDLVCRDLTPDS